MIIGFPIAMLGVFLIGLLLEGNREVIIGALGMVLLITGSQLIVL